MNLAVAIKVVASAFCFASLAHACQSDRPASPNDDNTDIDHVGAY